MVTPKAAIALAALTLASCTSIPTPTPAALVTESEGESQAETVSAAVYVPFVDRPSRLLRGARWSLGAVASEDLAGGGIAWEPGGNVLVGLALTSPWDFEAGGWGLGLLTTVSLDGLLERGEPPDDQPPADPVDSLSSLATTSAPAVATPMTDTPPSSPGQPIGIDWLFAGSPTTYVIGTSAGHRGVLRPQVGHRAFDSRGERRRRDLELRAQARGHRVEAEQLRRQAVATTSPEERERLLQQRQDLLELAAETDREAIRAVGEHWQALRDWAMTARGQPVGSNTEPGSRIGGVHGAGSLHAGEPDTVLAERLLRHPGNPLGVPNPDGRISERDSLACMAILPTCTNRIRRLHNRLFGTSHPDWSMDPASVDPGPALPYEVALECVDGTLDCRGIPAELCRIAGRCRCWERVGGPGRIHYDASRAECRPADVVAAGPDVPEPEPEPEPPEPDPPKPEPPKPEPMPPGCGELLRALQTAREAAAAVCPAVGGGA